MGVIAMTEVLQIMEYKREVRKKSMMAAPKDTLTFGRWNEEDKPIEETEKEGERDTSSSRRE